MARDKWAVISQDIHSVADGPEQFLQEEWQDWHCLAVESPYCLILQDWQLRVTVKKEILGSHDLQLVVVPASQVKQDAWQGSQF